MVGRADEKTRLGSSTHIKHSLNLRLPVLVPLNDLVFRTIAHPSAWEGIAFVVLISVEREDVDQSLLCNGICYNMLV